MENQEYCSSPSLWGKGMYTSLKEIVDGYMGNLLEDDYTYNVERRHVRKQAREGIKEFNFSSVKNFQRIELDLNKSLQVVLPPDYVDYYKISWIDDDGTVYPMVQNERLNLGMSVLQDNDYNFICDSNGKWITVDGTWPKYEDENENNNKNGFNVDRSMIFDNGFFKIDTHTGVIRFGSDAKEKKILLEYITDGYSGMNDSQIKIHKYASKAIDEFIYFELISRRINVPDREKRRARKSLNIAIRKMNNRMNPVREEDILQLLKAKSRWVKHT